MTLMGQYAWQGTVMTQVQGIWYPVCAGGLDAVDARATCTYLGYPAVLDVGSSGAAGITCRSSMCGNAVSSSNAAATVICQGEP